MDFMDARGLARKVSMFWLCVWSVGCKVGSFRRDQPALGNRWESSRAGLTQEAINVRLRGELPAAMPMPVSVIAAP